MLDFFFIFWGFVPHYRASSLPALNLLSTLNLFCLYTYLFSCLVLLKSRLALVFCKQWGFLTASFVFAIRQQSYSQTLNITNWPWRQPFFFCPDLAAGLTQCYGCVVLWVCSPDFPSCPTASVVFALHLYCVPAAPDSALAPCAHCPPGLVLSVVLPGVAVKRRRLPAMVKPWPFTGQRLDRSSKARCCLNLRHGSLSVLFISVSVWDLKWQNWMQTESMHIFMYCTCCLCPAPGVSETFSTLCVQQTEVKLREKKGRSLCIPDSSCCLLTSLHGSCGSPTVLRLAQG